MMETYEYFQLKAKVIEHGYLYEIQWAETVASPETPEQLFSEYSWVVINSGMKNQVAEKIWQRVQAAIEQDQPVIEVFKHPGKAAAIQEAWRSREQRFEQLRQAETEDRVIPWLQSLPWIGPTTCWHLAKNLGVDCAKPDRWLERVAAEADQTVPELCQRLADASGDRIGTVDVVIWRACNLGLAG